MASIHAARQRTDVPQKVGCDESHHLHGPKMIGAIHRTLPIAARHFERSKAESRNLPCNCIVHPARTQISPLHPDFIGIPVEMTMPVNFWLSQELKGIR